MTPQCPDLLSLDAADLLATMLFLAFRGWGFLDQIAPVLNLVSTFSLLRVAADAALV